MMYKNAQEAFDNMGRSAKVEFINNNIEYASISVMVNAMKPYIFDVFDAVEKQTIEIWMAQNGYVKKEEKK